MNRHHVVPRRLPLIAVAAALTALAASGSAFAHARVSPPVSVSGTLQLYSLAVPTEKAGATTTRIALTVPQGFSIDSFVPSPGWHRVVQQTGSGDSAVIQKVTWAGGSVPTGEDSLFQFLGEPAKSGTYTFQVQQTYSDGAVVNWSDPETGADPAPAIQAKSSLGGGGVGLLTIVALALGIVGILVGGIALVSGGGGRRELA